MDTIAYGMDVFFIGRSCYDHDRAPESRIPWNDLRVQIRTDNYLSLRRMIDVGRVESEREAVERYEQAGL